MEALDYRGAGVLGRRSLLVGFPPLIGDGIAPELAKVSDVMSVPFPGQAFDAAVDGFDPHCVIVDGTYFDEDTVRPLIAHRFLRSKPMVVYLTQNCTVFLAHDLRTGDIARGDATVAALVALAAGRLTESGLRWSPSIARSVEPIQIAPHDACNPQAQPEGDVPHERRHEMIDFISIRLAALRQEENGQALVEYSLILALVSVVAIAALTTVGNDVNTILGKVATALTGAAGG
jgi:pilus assembly protein Flp/PilA